MCICSFNQLDTSERVPEMTACGEVTAAQSSRCCKSSKRKEHDTSPRNCCKFTKPSDSPPAETADMAPYWRSWMSPTSNDREAYQVVHQQTYQKYHNLAEKFSTTATEEILPPEMRIKKNKSSSSKIKHLTKKIAKIQLEIDNFEMELEEKAGHPLSKADKIKDETLGNLILKKKELKKEKQKIKDKEKDKPKPTIEVVKDSIEESMENVRKLAGRPECLDDMTYEELVAEKEELQEQLDEAAEEHSLAKKEDRKVMADLFLRLRQLKRLTRRSSFSSGNLLDEIPEHSSVELVTGRRNSVESFSEEELEEGQEEQVETQEEEEKEEESEWHVMTKGDLRSAVVEMKAQKSQLKQLIREFDQGVQSKTGRKVSKEDRQPIETIYQSYKKTKQRIKLIEALLIK